MPSVNFKVTWPDGEQATYYSPSTVVYEHLTADRNYTQAEFTEHIHAALHAASERVYKKFGYYCTAASAELEKINRKLQFLREQKITGEVHVVQFN